MAEFTWAWSADCRSPKILVRMDAVVGLMLPVVLEAAETTVSNASASGWGCACVNAGTGRSLLARLAISNITTITPIPMASSGPKPLVPARSKTKFSAVKMTASAAINVVAAASRGARGSCTTQMPCQAGILCLLVSGQGPVLRLVPCFPSAWRWSSALRHRAPVITTLRLRLLADRHHRQGASHGRA